MNRSSFSERSSLPPLIQIAVSFALTAAVAAVLLVLGTAVSCQVADPAAIAKPLGIGIMLLTSTAAGFFFSRCPVRWYLVGPLGGVLLQLVLLLLSFLFYQNGNGGLTGVLLRLLSVGLVTAGTFLGNHLRDKRRTRSPRRRRRR